MRALGRAAATKELASCYIFSGTRGIGKTTIARLFAKALICEQGPAEDCCNQCVPCTEVTEGRNMDVLEIDAATHTGIDDVRELREAALYPPQRDRYRLFILDEAHQLSTAAWNGLLKVLEEPPPWCLFIFCTTEPHKIPATIESRALHFAFKSPAPAQIKRYLAELAKKEQIAVDDEALLLLADVANGSVRDGLSALDQVRALSGETIDAAEVRQALGLIPGEAVARYLEALGRGDAVAALQVVADLEEEGQDLRSFAGDLLERVRQLALAQVTGGAAPAGFDPNVMALFQTEQLVWLGRVLDETEARLRQAGPTRALLDLATVRMTKMARLPELGALIEALSNQAPVASGRGGTAPAATPSVAPSPTSRSAPPTASTKSPPTAAPSAGGPFRQQLLTTAGEIRPAMAAYLGSVKEATLDDDGTLRLTLAAGKEVWKEKLLHPTTQEVLSTAVQRISGREMIRVVIDSGTSEAPPSSPAASRKEVLDKARKDPVVRALFDRFGAVVLDGQALTSEPQEE